jgi:signal transduction histidine kinase
MLIADDDQTRVFRGRGYERFGTAAKLDDIHFKISDVPGLRQIQLTQQPLVVPDVEAYAQWVVSIPEHDWIRSYIGVPMLSRDGVIGFLNVMSGQRNFFQPADGNRLAAFANHAAIAVENARLYSALQRQNEDLEAAVQARSRQLAAANEELQAINYVLKQSNEELNAFAHTVAHDLQNPLANILGFVEMIEYKLGRDGRDPANIRDDLQTIERSVNQVSKIIADLLLLASVRQQAIPLQPIDTAVIIENVEFRLLRQIQTDGAELIKPPKWPQALGHAPWVEAIWSNYISNGLKYGGSPPRLTLGADKLADGMIRFWVQDNGPGLTAEQQAKLFVEFARLDERKPGAGLGLSIVRRIAEKLGGQAGVSGEPGRGSRFHFTLPAA